MEETGALSVVGHAGILSNLYFLLRASVQLPFFQYMYVPQLPERPVAAARVALA